MFIRRVLSLVFLATALVSAAQAQAQPPPLRDAGRALVDALTRRDRASFEQLLAPDAVFFLPIATHGADAIVRAWLPFLVVDGAQAMTMTLTADEPVIAGSGDLGYATGTFAFKNQASSGSTKEDPRPMPRMPSPGRSNT